MKLIALIGIIAYIIIMFVFSSKLTTKILQDRKNKNI